MTFCNWALVTSCVLIGTATAQDAPDPLVVAASKAAYPIEFKADGAATGPGWDRLVSAASDAQFTLIGEQHSVADIAQISAQLQKSLVPAGYDYLAIEVGPYATEFAEDLLRKTGGKAEFANIAAVRPDQFAYPFLSLAEELDLVADMVKSSKRKPYILWGFDQEFIGAGKLMAQRLEKMAKTPEQKAVVATFAAAMAKDRMALGGGSESDILALKPAFAGHRAATALIDDLVLSNRIYAPFSGKPGAAYTANLARENYMKQQFMIRIRAVEKRDGALPHVLFKFGANHAGRGISPTDVPALGQFVSDFAESRGGASIHVAMDCAGGFQRDYGSGKAEPCESMAPGDSLFYKVAAPGGMTLIDLRAIRPEIRRKSKLDPETRRLIFAFDYIVVFRDPKPATLLK